MTLGGNTTIACNVDSGGQPSAECHDSRAPHPPGHYCQTMTRTVLQAVSALLIKNADNGMISVEKARALLRQLGDASPELVSIYAGQEDKCRRLLWRRFDDSARRDPFRRLMTRPLETLMGGNPPAFSRDYLGNYFKLIETVYAQHFADYEGQCRAILHALLVVHGQGLTWEEFYADPRTQRVLAHALRRLVTFLDTPAGQWLWMETMSRGDGDHRPPSTASTDQLLETLRDTWHGLELGRPVVATEAGR